MDIVIEFDGELLDLGINFFSVFQMPFGLDWFSFSRDS